MATNIFYPFDALSATSFKEPVSITSCVPRTIKPRPIGSKSTASLQCGVYNTLQRSAKTRESLKVTSGSYFRENKCPNRCSECCCFCKNIIKSCRFLKKQKTAMRELRRRPQCRQTGAKLHTKVSQYARICTPDESRHLVLHSDTY